MTYRKILQLLWRMGQNSGLKQSRSELHVVWVIPSQHTTEEKTSDHWRPVFPWWLHLGGYHFVLLICVPPTPWWHLFPVDIIWSIMMWKNIEKINVWNSRGGCRSPILLVNASFSNWIVFLPHIFFIYRSGMGHHLCQMVSAKVLIGHLQRRTQHLKWLCIIYLAFLTILLSRLAICTDRAQSTMATVIYLACLTKLNWS